MNGIQFVSSGDKMKWNQDLAAERIIKKAGQNFLITTFVIKDLHCSSGTIQEFFNFAVPYISADGLTKFELSNLPEEIVLDVGAIKEILLRSQSSLETISLTGMSRINEDSLKELLQLVINTLHSHHPSLQNIILSEIYIKEPENTPIF